MDLAHSREHRGAVTGELAPIGGAWRGSPQPENI